jgi:hypothetical protein
MPTVDLKGDFQLENQERDIGGWAIALSAFYIRKGGQDGNVGIIRSPVRAIVLPD